MNDSEVLSVAKFLCFSYANEPDDKLTKDAVKLKLEVREFLDAVIGEYLRSMNYDDLKKLDWFASIDEKIAVSKEYKR